MRQCNKATERAIVRQFDICSNQQGSKVSAGSYTYIYTCISVCGPPPYHTNDRNMHLPIQADFYLLAHANTCLLMIVCNGIFDFTLICVYVNFAYNCTCVCISTCMRVFTYIYILIYICLPTYLPFPRKTCTLQIG